MNFIYGFITGLVITALVLLVWWMRQNKDEKPTKDEQPEKHSSDETVLVLLGQDSGVDILTEMLRIQYTYMETQSVPDSAMFLIRDFLDILARKLNLQPIEKYGAKVPFNPDLHQAYEYHEEGEMVWIIQPGWQQNQKILINPLVQTKPIEIGESPIDPIQSLVGIGTGVDILTAFIRLENQLTDDIELSEEVKSVAQLCLHEITDRLNIYPLEQVGKIVYFDPEKHYTNQASNYILEKEQVLVIYPGWQYQQEVIKRALVGKIRKGDR